MNAPDPETDSLIGTLAAGKYRIDALLGRGGMGAVYQATHQAIGKRVALKFLWRDAARDADAVTRFQREAEAASRVESAHIVQIFDSGATDDGLPFLVMELLTGEDLRTRLRREGRLGLAEAIHVAGQVARGLIRAHEAGIVHRDLKPDNIFLCRRDDDPVFVKIVDFGISKVARGNAGPTTLTRRGVVLGTAFYMSPEQARAYQDVDGRTDLFSLGAILYEMLTGRPPHTGPAYEAVLIDICTQDAPDVRTLAPDVPASVAMVVARALERDRDERFQSAAEFYDALALAAPGLLKTGTGPRGPTPGESGESSASRTRPDPVGDLGGGTGAGAAVSPAPSPGLTARRTVVTAVVAALAAFAITAVLMARNAANSVPSAPTAEFASAAPKTMAEPDAASAVEDSTREDGGAGDAAALAASSSGPHSPKAVASSTHLPKAASSRGKHDTTGVAKGLKLVTEP
jgi:eukaryotic-like serine/threonine-protein kinase